MQNNYTYIKKDLPSVLGKFGYTFLLVGIVATVLAFIFDPTRATFNSLLTFTYLMGIGICALFLIGLEYLTDAVWSVGFRRIAEYLAVLIVIAPIFAIPVLLNMHDVFHWTHEEAVATDVFLSKKAPYLNLTFFVIRFIGIVLVMGLFLLILVRNSARQDISGDQKITHRNIKWSAVMMPFLGISTTMIAIDFLMSLEPHWFSTIFGVYYFSGSLLTTFAIITLFAVKLRDWGILPEFITKDHFYNLGAFMFAFINFWAYIAFSQYLLIWYANIPEETFWYLLKFEGSWVYVSLGLIFIQFLIPYAALVSQPAKSNYKRLKIMAIWLIFAHFYDLYWLAMSTYNKDGAFFGWIEIAFIVLGIGIVATLFKIIYNKRNLVPVGDPKLKRCMDFHL
jgi:hypothetical protein